MAGWFMAFNTTFNNISVIQWQSVLLVEETGVPGENHRPVVSGTPRHERGSNSQPYLVVKGKDCTGSCKSNYHMITTTTAFLFFLLNGYMCKESFSSDIIKK
jgi:hypothetical protein